MNLESGMLIANKPVSIKVKYIELLLNFLAQVRFFQSIFNPARIF